MKPFIFGGIASLFLLLASIPEDLYFEISVLESIIFAIIIGLISASTNNK
jgi:hypothetical protein